MNIRDLQEKWDKFGKADPLWAILTHPNKKGGKWERKEFFDTGIIEIDNIMNYIKSIKSLDFKLKNKNALDFGCGVGRLTQALANYFDYVCGVDIAPSMIKLAKKYNKYNDKCHYFLNDSNDLNLFGDNSFDFIYSNIVLQHIEPEYSKKYIKEFLRIINHEGIIIFQIPSEPNISSNGHNISSKNSTLGADIRIKYNLDKMEMKSGSQKIVYAKIKNIGKDSWNISDNIRFGNHWLDNKKNMIILDDARAELIEDLNPGGEVELSLTIKAPDIQGDYLLEFDMVKEGITWFKDLGSNATISPIKVFFSNPIKRFLSGIMPIINIKANLKKLPKMDMYAIKKSEIIDIINDNGGRLINIKEDYSAGKEWISYRYFITKQ